MGKHQWAGVGSGPKNFKYLVIDSFYCPPTANSSPFAELSDVLCSAFKQKGKTVISGDFRMKGINW